MTREEFIKVLEEKGYSYKIEGDRIVVTDGSPPTSWSLGSADVILGLLETLPPGVEFRNGKNVYLKSLKTLPPGVEFKNEWDVYLNSIIPGCLSNWEGNIEGIDRNILLNLMIKQEMFI